MVKGNKRNLGRPRRGGPKKPHRANFKPGQNSQTGEVHRRGVDLIPRKQVERAALLKALTEAEYRDIKSGKRVNGKRHALLVRGAMLEDMAIGFRRIAYEAAHGKDWTPAAGALLIKLGEHIGVYLDDKPATLTRTTTFVPSPGEPSKEIPPEQGRLSAAEGAFEEVREEEVP